MRALSRWTKRRYAQWRLAPRLRSLEAELAHELRSPVRLEAAGARGRDGIYRVLAPRGPVAMLRVVNPYLHRKALAPDSPFRVPSDAARLEREWRCYERGCPQGLTPRPLWRTGDALLCEYVRGTRLSERLLARAALFWDLMARGAHTLSRLHALGLSHMDASLANMIERDGDTVLIDFEYAPVPSLSEAQQRAYDHLRLLESAIKFIPSAERDCARWLEALEEALGPDTRHAELAPLRPALGRVLAHEGLRPGLAAIFPRLHTEA